MFHRKLVYTKRENKRLNGSSSLLLLLLTPLYYLDNSFRNRTVEPLLFLQDLPVGIKRNIHRYRAGAFKQCLDPEQTVFHSPFSNFLELDLVHKAAKRSHGHVVIGCHASLAFVLI